MRIDATATGLLLSAISTLVVIIGALAGLQQLRHIRHGNELATLTELQAQFDTPDMVEARNFVRAELKAALDDPTFLAELRCVPIGPRAQYVARVADFFELLGIYVSYGALSPPMTLTLWGVIVARHWQIMRPAVLILREDRMVLGFFEDLAVRSDHWLHGAPFRKQIARLARDPSSIRSDAAPPVSDR